MAAARAKFAELRALRASGKKQLTTYKVKDKGDIYNEVDEEEYKKLDNFIIDDTDEGYTDDGREESLLFEVVHNLRIQSFILHIPSIEEYYIVLQSPW
ncbi:hypothetical protein AJ78_08604 [Emergomyces pasteurianus Ep9510]|uniref:DNA polymerase alpha catalytic subunit N-terminal domain-containing protein n=1 Tax=Emergomyces pasteurianus Ep9510 TaxID=1447872 RepID=A0A1J9Q5B6_9EURO|nr:hypothetical protein AJ78_08604 [Emergomyces pasteurianus Ep9510]